MARNGSAACAVAKWAKTLSSNGRLTSARSIVANGPAPMLPPSANTSWSNTPIEANAPFALAGSAASIATARALPLRRFAS